MLQMLAFRNIEYFRNEKEIGGWPFTEKSKYLGNAKLREKVPCFFI